MSQIDAALTDYDSFYEMLDNQLEGMERIAQLQLDLEMFNIQGYIPFVDTGHNDAEKADIAGAADAIRSFAGAECVGDYEALEDMRFALSSVHRGLNGEAGDKSGEGLGAEVGSITEGLVSWQNETADIFRSNYVYSIQSRQTNQAISIDRAKSALQTAMDILVGTRYHLSDMVHKAALALCFYNPIKDAGFALMKVSFTVIGIVTGPTLSALLTVTTAALPKDSGLTVAGLMQSIRDSLPELEKSKGEAISAACDVLDGYAQEEAGDWQNYVCSRPAPPEPPSHPGESNPNHTGGGV